jgi:hypothetical protein
VREGEKSERASEKTRKEGEGKKSEDLDSSSTFALSS